MKNVFETLNKYFLITLSFIFITVTILTFTNTEIINDIISKLASNQLVMNLFISFVAIIVIATCFDIIRKMSNSKKVGVFLSCAHSSKEDMDKVKRILSSTNNYKIYDFELISVGQDIQTEIIKMMDISKILIILFDENYFQSKHCLNELETITNSGKFIMPILKSSKYTSQLPAKISKLKYLIISDDESWEKTFESSLPLYKQYNQLDKSDP